MPVRLDALGETAPFDGFVEADFDAFERKKWGSRVYTLERRAARQKLVALARALLESKGPFEGLDLGASDDAPSMSNQRKVDAVWAYLTRAASARAALASRLGKTDLADANALFDILVEHQHASLLLRLDHSSFQLELHLSPRARVDRTNAATKLGYQEDRALCVEICRSLPEDAGIGFEGELGAPSTIDESVVDAWREPLSGAHRAFIAGWRLERGDPRLARPELGDDIRGVAEAMARLLRHLAWAKDNDFARIGVEKAVEKVEKKLGKTKKGAAAVAELAPGTRVTILSGLFAGRAGYLAEQEGKGKVKVMVGPVSVSVSISDVKAS